jgi:hypothetical protein
VNFGRHDLVSRGGSTSRRTRRRCQPHGLRTAARCTSSAGDRGLRGWAYTRQARRRHASDGQRRRSGRSAKPNAKNHEVTGKVGGSRWEWRVPLPSSRGSDRGTAGNDIWSRSTVSRGHPAGAVGDDPEIHPTTDKIARAAAMRSRSRSSGMASGEIRRTAPTRRGVRDGTNGLRPRGIAGS